MDFEKVALAMIAFSPLALIVIVLGCIYSSKVWGFLRSTVDEVHVELWGKLAGLAVFYGFAFAGIPGIRRNLVIWCE